MSSKKFRLYQSLSDKLTKVGEKFSANHAISKIEENDNPDDGYDKYRASIRIIIDHKVHKKGAPKSMPVLNVYDANDLDLEKLQNSLVSAAISVLNTRMKLAQENRNFRLFDRASKESIGINKTGIHD